MPLTQPQRKLKFENLALSGTAYDVSNIPDWANKIELTFENFSSSGTNSAYLRVGSGGVPDTVNYKSNNFTVSTANVANSGSIATDRFKMPAIGAQADTANYYIVLKRSGGNKWHLTGVGLCDQATDLIAIMTGYIELAAALNIIRVTFANGTDTIDGGTLFMEVTE